MTTRRPAASSGRPSGRSRPSSTSWRTRSSPWRDPAALRCTRRGRWTRCRGPTPWPRPRPPWPTAPRAARAVCETGHSGAWRHRQHLGLPGPRLPAAGAPVRRRVRRGRGQPGPGAVGSGRRGRSWTSLTPRKSSPSGCGCATGCAATTRGCRRPRRPTSTGPARPPGTRRSTTPGSSACRGRRRSGGTATRASTRSSSTRSSSGPARHPGRAWGTWCRASCATATKTSGAASCQGW